MRVGEPLHGTDEVVEDVGGVVQIVKHEPVESDVAQEGHRSRPVLGVDRAARQSLPEAARNELLEVDRRALGRAETELIDLGGPTEEDAGAAPCAEGRARKQPRGLGAEEDLRRGGRRLHVDRARGGRTRDDQLAMRPADEEEVEVAAVHSHRHPERHVARVRREPLDPPELGAHRVRGGGRPQVVILAREPQELGVAAELQQVGAERVGGGKEPSEGAVDDLGDLLGTDMAVPCQPFGHPRETGDVDERHGPLERAMQPSRRLLVPVADEAGDVRLEHVRGGGSGARGHRVVTRPRSM
ncbi:hypothetical protein BCL57_000115 [Agromyces flavus]|uniref:Uncharacterized protein n=1 Tax=Agromyces flavus TaxID=589382 RepID=A0ABT1KGK9_9MICO|nr:hypothetical protein [Agromyces flavus]MCP2365973.1 hypothetical protein [Agromyces flavus]